MDSAQAAQSYSDAPLPLGHGQTISQPYIVALMLEALSLQPDDKVLEIGSGSGYQTALLAELAGEVFAVERLDALYRKGEGNLRSLGYEDIKLKLSDGTLGWPEEAPFDAMIVAAGGPQVPPPLIEQLAPGGRLVLPVGPDGDRQELVLLTKNQNGQVSRRALAGCRFVALVGRHGW